MRAQAGASDGDFTLKNYTQKQGSTPAYDYRLENVKVHTEISRHYDFVTATAEGSSRANAADGQPLNFEHQLSRIVVTAWGNTENDIEIAGVRIGGAVTEGNFNFAGVPNNYVKGDATANGNWILPSTPVRACMEYIFR